jgi:hypothetical protein
MATPVPSHAILDRGITSLRPWTLARLRALRFGLSLYRARAGPEKVPGKGPRSHRRI